MLKSESKTQAYHAGALYAMTENAGYAVPGLATCLISFYSLRQLFGERLWQKLKTKPRFKERIAMYEALAYQIGRPKDLLGTPSDFCLGYVKVYKHSKLKLNRDKARLYLQ